MPVDVSLALMDYAVAIGILLLPLVIGVYFAVKDAHRSSRDQYLLGGRKMPLVPVMLSLFITFQGSSQLTLPVESYHYGGIYILTGVGLGLSFVVSAYTIVPLLHPLRITSVYEYLELRYRSGTVRMMSALVGIMTTICFMVIALLLPALALEASAGIPLWATIALLGAVGTLYTALGGFKTVVWTDMFQTVVIAVGVVIILVKAIVGTRDIGSILRHTREGGRLDFNRFSPDPRVRHSIWCVIIAHCFMWLVHGFSQPTFQRISSLRTMHGAKVTFLNVTVLVIVYSAVISCLGLVIFAYFSMKQCDPLEVGLISSQTQLVPHFVMNAMTDVEGIRGLYIASLCCGSLSTLSSGLNALAANTVEDLLRQPLQRLSEDTVTLITKLSAVVYGIMIIGLAYLAKCFQDTVIVMVVAIFGAFGPPVAGIFILGASVPWANKFGALAGAIVSLVFNLWISIGSKLYASPPTTLPSVGMAGCSVLADVTNTTDANLKGSIYDNISSSFAQNENLTDTNLNSYGSSIYEIVSYVFVGNESSADAYLESYGNENSSSVLNRFLNSTDIILKTSSLETHPAKFNSAVNDSAIQNPIQEESNTFVLYTISPEWYSMMGIVICITIGLVVSYIVECLVLYRHEESPSERSNKARYIFPFLRKFWDMEYREFKVYSASYIETPLVLATRSMQNHRALHRKEFRQLTKT